MTLKNMHLLLVLALVLLIGCTPAPVTDQPAAADEATEAAGGTSGVDDGVVRIGFVADMTGVGYLFGQSQLAGLQIAVAEINEAGGINGQPVEIITYDAQLKPDLAATLARQMILEDGADFLLAGTSSAAALAISEVAKEHKVVVGFHTSNSVQITADNGHPYMFQVVPHTTIEARAAAIYAADRGYTTWATIGPDYAFGHDEFNAFSGKLAELNPDAEIVNEQWPALAERDLTAYITAMQGSSPDAVFGSLWGDQLVTFVQQAEPLGLFDDTMYLGLFDTDAMKALGEDLPEGHIGFARAAFYAIDTPEMDSFVEKYRALAKEYPSDWGIMMYDAVYVLKAAAEKAGTTEGDAVAAALDDLQVDSLRGTLTIRACDHMANVGEYVGITTQTDEYPFPILTDVEYIPAEDVWLSCEEVQSLRDAAASN